MSILFIINPTAGTQDNEKTELELWDYCNEKKLDYKVYRIPDDKEPQHLKGIIESIDPKTVIACGGDGTVNYIGNFLLHSNIKMGILPFGSANGLATELSFTLNAKELIDKIIRGKTFKMDVLKINNKHYCYHLSSMGFNAHLVRRFEESNGKGMWGYARHFFETLKKGKPHKYTFHINGAKFTRRAEMVTIANATKYGTGAVINPDGKMDDGKFEVCIFKPFPWYALFRLAYLFFMGNLKNSPFVKIISTNKTTVEAHNKEVLEVDGNIEGKVNKIEVEVLQGAINMLY